MALQIIPCVIVEFTVQQGLEKLRVLASAIHLLCFSLPCYVILMSMYYSSNDHCR